MNDDASDSWFDRHPYLATALFLVGVALLLWLAFRKGGAAPAALPASPVSPWTPLP